MARLRNGMREWASHTMDNLYKWGAEMEWLRARCERGEYQPMLIELGLKKSTADNWRHYYRECKEHNRMVIPHWARDKKSPTIGLLEVDEPEADLKKKRPKHDSEPLNWSAAETADRIFELFEKLTERRKLEEMEDVVAQLNERIHEYIESRREEKLMIHGGAVGDRLDEIDC